MNIVIFSNELVLFSLCFVSHLPVSYVPHQLFGKHRPDMIRPIFCHFHTNNVKMSDKYLKSFEDKLERSKIFKQILKYFCEYISIYHSRLAGQSHDFRKSANQILKPYMKHLFTTNGKNQSSIKLSCQLKLAKIPKYPNNMMMLTCP